jgi:IclR family transcriptional regulator, pca regulon regulatory protein
LNEAASIAAIDGSEMVYLERLQLPLGRLGITQRVGARVPVYCTAVGHAILAYLPVEERMQILNARERAKLTPNTPVSIAEIESRLQKVRENGYAVSDQDTVLGVRVIAAPIFDPDDRPWAAISAAAPWMACYLTKVSRISGSVAHAAGR